MSTKVLKINEAGFEAMRQRIANLKNIPVREMTKERYEKLAEGSTAKIADPNMTEEEKQRFYETERKLEYYSREGGG